MMKYGDTYLRAALDETPGGLQGEPYLKALEEFASRDRRFGKIK